METQPHSLLVQYRLKGWGNEEDLQRRHFLEGLLDEALQAEGNGECDGGDIGSGTMTIYLEEISDPLRAFQTIVDVLHKAEELNGVTIAQCHSGAVNDDGIADMERYSVLWPTDFKGEFDPL